ncbi:hypothetical protein [Streptomyces sp. WAC05858]|uniref:hypothetical protein n=1 Tax=Streptomyces TaxID=1883 RepID=UPI000F78C82F|nr:hypothetical protein [Streptomyces sp. WAC05858]RSS47567.1 hypothetical protein EF902_08930 [Streptomyces sp. WAC05858]
MGLKRLAKQITYTQAKHEKRMALINEAGALRETADAAAARGDVATETRARKARRRLLDETRPW